MALDLPVCLWVGMSVCHSPVEYRGCFGQPGFGVYRKCIANELY